jgi:hypothetical protein
MRQLASSDPLMNRADGAPLAPRNLLNREIGENLLFSEFETSTGNLRREGGGVPCYYKHLHRLSAGEASPGSET